MNKKQYMVVWNPGNIYGVEEADEGCYPALKIFDNYWVAHGVACTCNATQEDTISNTDNQRSRWKW